MNHTRRDWREIKGRCPVCGHDGWCTIDVAGQAILCKRSPSDRPVKQRDGSIAWLHPATGNAKPAPLKKKTFIRRGDIDAMLKVHHAAVAESKLARFAESLSLSPVSLRHFGIGWDSSRGAWSFPMRNGDGQAVGIHYRDHLGHKSCLRGSNLGLFMPEKFPVVKSGDGPSPLLLIVPEGITDACAAFDLGFPAVGRPSNAAGGDDVCRLLRVRPGYDVVVFADNDPAKYLPDGVPFWPGIEGGLHLTRLILPHCFGATPAVARLRFMMPPKGTKDLREWIKSGSVTFAAFSVAMMKLPTVDGRWMQAASRRLAAKKVNERRKAVA